MWWPWKENMTKLSITVSDFSAGSCHFSQCLGSSWTFRHSVNDHQSNWWLWVSDALLNVTAVASRSGQTSENEILSLVFPSHGMHYTHTCGITDGAIAQIQFLLIVCLTQTPTRKRSYLFSWIVVFVKTELLARSTLERIHDEDGNYNGAVVYVWCAQQLRVFTGWKQCSLILCKTTAIIINSKYLWHYTLKKWTLTGGQRPPVKRRNRLVQSLKYCKLV